MTTNVSTRIGGDGARRAEGLSPATHPAVVALFGAKPLDGENVAPAAAGVTVDALADWVATTLITLSSQFPVGPDEASELAALGVPGAATSPRCGSS